RIVAAIQPHQHARMTAQPRNLAGERRLGDLAILWRPLVPMLPMIAAAPTRHHQNPITVREIEELVTLELAFKANGVQAQIANMRKFILHPLMIGAQKHVRRPSATTNQDPAMIDAEELIAIGILLVRNLANSEVGGGSVGER